MAAAAWLRYRHKVGFFVASKLILGRDSIPVPATNVATLAVQSPEI